MREVNNDMKETFTDDRINCVPVWDEGGLLFDVCSLPSVNYISHTIKTCMRKNFIPYAIAMHEVVFTSPAMWLFDVI